MKHLWWVIPLAAALAAFRVWWAGPADIVVLLILVCGIAGVGYLVMRPQGSTLPPRSEQEPDTRHVERDLPPPPG